MTILALDLGEKRCGIAVSDASEKLALPLAVLLSSEVLAKTASFYRILDDYQPKMLLFGLPLSLDGSEHAQAVKIKETAAKISALYKLPIDFWDERMSSVEAKRMLKEQGCTEKQMRGKIDKIAASLFLQSYLDSAQTEGFCEQKRIS